MVDRMSTDRHVSKLLPGNSTSKFEMGGSDWSSVRNKSIKLYNKFGMVRDCSFIKLHVPVGGHGTDDLAFGKVNLWIAFVV